MSIPQLNSCCCGCSLKTGSNIIGWLSLIAHIFLITISELALSVLNYIEEHPDELTPETKEIYDHLAEEKAFVISNIIGHIVGCGFSFILLLGVYQEKAKLILVWVVVSLTFSTIILLMKIVQVLISYQPGSPGEIIFFFLDLYFILVVYSFYREIKKVGNHADYTQP